VVSSWNELIADFDDDEVARFASTLSRLLVAAERMLDQDSTGSTGETAA